MTLIKWQNQHLDEQTGDKEKGFCGYLNKSSRLVLKHVIVYADVDDDEHGEGLVKDHLHVRPLKEIDRDDGKYASSVEKDDWIRPDTMVLIAPHIPRVVKRSNLSFILFYVK